MIFCMVCISDLINSVALYGEETAQVVVSPRMEWRAGKAKGMYRALIVGISNYEDGRIPNLETAVGDARQLADILEKEYGFSDVVTLLDSEATRRGILIELVRLVKQSTVDDSVLIYYAGHGELENKTGRGWWIPYDAEFGKTLGYLDNVIIWKSVNTIKARHVLLVADSSFANRHFGEEKALPSVIDDKWYAEHYKKRSRWGIISGKLTIVDDQDCKVHSLFACNFLKILQKNTQTYLSPRQICAKIWPIIKDKSKTGLMPIIKPISSVAHKGGEFIFIRGEFREENEDQNVFLSKLPQILKKTGHLEIFINVDHAKVLIKGVPKGSVKKDRPLNIHNQLAGELLVRLESEGYKPMERFVNIKVDQLVKEMFMLEEKTDEEKDKRKNMLSIAMTKKVKKSKNGKKGKKIEVRSLDERYIDHDDGTITDTKTGLMWTQDDSYLEFKRCLNWIESKEYVAGLTTGGFGDWRLPTVEELQDIYEEAKSSVMPFNNDHIFKLHLDAVFSDGAGYCLWSSEEAGLCCARCINFYDGKVRDSYRTYCTYQGVRAVRSVK